MSKDWSLCFWKRIYFGLLTVANYLFLCFPQLYLTGAVYSLDGSDSLRETMQTSVNYPQQVNKCCLVLRLKPSQRIKQKQPLCSFPVCLLVSPSGYWGGAFGTWKLHSHCALLFTIHCLPFLEWRWTQWWCAARWYHSQEHSSSCSRGCREARYRTSQLAAEQGSQAHPQCGKATQWCPLSPPISSAHGHDSCNLVGRFDG